MRRTSRDEANPVASTKRAAECPLHAEKAGEETHVSAHDAQEDVWLTLRSVSARYCHQFTYEEILTLVADGTLRAKNFGSSDRPDIRMQERSLCRFEAQAMNEFWKTVGDEDESGEGE